MKSGKLRYSPRKVASELTGIGKVRATLKMMYTPTYEKNGICLRVDVWSKAKKRAKVTEKPYKNNKKSHVIQLREIQRGEISKKKVTLIMLLNCTK